MNGLFNSRRSASAQFRTRALVLLVAALAFGPPGCSKKTPKYKGDACSPSGDTDGSGSDPCPGSLVCAEGGAGQPEYHCQDPYDQCHPDCLKGWTCQTLKGFDDDCAFTKGTPGCGFCQRGENEWLWPGQPNPPKETCEEDAVPGSLCWVLFANLCDEANPLPFCANEMVHPVYAQDYVWAVDLGKASADFCGCFHSYDNPESPPPPHGQWPDTPEPLAPGYPPVYPDDP